MSKINLSLAGLAVLFLCSIVLCGCPSPDSASIPMPPPPARNPSPADEEISVPITSDLSWAAPPVAASYDVYIGMNETNVRDATTGSPEFKGNQDTTVYDFPGKFAYSIPYYWRIDTVNAIGTTPGNVWKFTTEGSPVGNPAQVADPSPADQAEEVPVGTYLSWGAASGAESYDVWFGTDPALLLLIGNTDSLSFKPDPGDLAYETDYYWRIDAQNGIGTTTGIVWKFTTQEPPPDQVQNPYPPDGMTDVPRTEELTWDPAARAAWYNVYIGPQADSLVFVGTVTDTRHDPGLFAYSTTYYWRIDAVNAAGVTTGQVWSFSTESMPSPSDTPDQASGPTPADGAVNVPVDIMLAWRASHNTTQYRVYFGTDPNPNNLPLVAVQANLTFHPGSLFFSGHLEYSTMYYWRIDALNGPSIKATGPVWTFVTVAEPKITNIWPPDGAVDVPVTVNFRWGPAPSAVSYDVYLGTIYSSVGGAVHTSPEYMGNQTELFFNPDTLQYSIMYYYWRVDVINSNGVVEKGDIYSFRTEIWPPDPPEEAVWPYPLDEVENVPVDVDFHWYAAVGALSYKIYLGTSPGLLTTVVGETTALTIDPGVLDYSQQYYWRIDVINFNGTTQGTEYSFTTESGAEGTVVYVDCENGDDLNNGLTWATAVRTLSRAVDIAAVSGWTVLVRRGTYFGTDNIGLETGNKSILFKAIGGIYHTFIDCQKMDRAFFIWSPGSHIFRIEGFTIQNATAYYGTAAHDGLGGAIFLRQLQLSVIKDCRIRYCCAYMGGGAIFCVSTTSVDHYKPEINNCLFIGNFTTPDFAGEGGAFLTNRLPPYITPNYTSATFLHSIFTGNTADGNGGAMRLRIDRPGAETNLFNCILEYNTGENGGGIYNTQTLVTRNCNIVWNMAMDNGGGIWNSGTVTMNSDIMWYNDYSLATGMLGREMFTTSSTTFNYCCFREVGEYVYSTVPLIFVPNTSGHLREVNPLWITGPRGDYYLKNIPPDAQQSECVDHGIEFATAVGLDDRTTRRDCVLDTGIVDVGYHYEP